MSVAGEGRRTKRPVTDWTARGVRRTDGTALPDSLGAAGLLTLAGAKGPAFLVTRNFDALYSYNAAESYGLAIAHLSDRLRGAGPLATPWPTNDPGLSRAERRELQGLLVMRGHDIGPVDGMLGNQSRVAIRADGAALIVTVDDDGPGIPEAELERVFQPFYRLEDSRSRETGGIGLGLAIALSIAQSHGGTLKLANRAEGGLRATLSLPI
jgi:hypothetical protein